MAQEWHLSTVRVMESTTSQGVVEQLTATL